jgi:TorA maturation chaperone TorD
MNDAATADLPEEDRWRAEAYALLARLLAAPPDRALLDRLAAIPGEPAPDDPPLARAWKKLAESARRAEPDGVAGEYQAVFIGPTRGEVMPYGSFYLTGFLMEKPLAALRTELADLGIARRDSVPEPEDHAAAVCEAMSLLIGSGDARQTGFFRRHLSPWLGRFFEDLRAAESARFYRAVGEIGAAFFEVEQHYLDMAQPGSGHENTPP